MSLGAGGTWTMDMLVTLATLPRPWETRGPAGREADRKGQRPAGPQLISLERRGRGGTKGGRDLNAGSCPSEPCSPQAGSVSSFRFLHYLFSHVNKRPCRQNTLKNQPDDWVWTWPSKIFEILKVAEAEEAVEKKLFLKFLTKLNRAWPCAEGSDTSRAGLATRLQRPLRPPAPP